MYSDGYKYWLAYKKNKTSYYRCSRYKTLCPGRCVVEDTKIRNATAHNHPPEPDRVLVDKFRKALTQRAAVEQTDLYSIYWEEASQRHSDAALLYTFNAAESAMRKARRKQLPQTPYKIQEIGDFLSTSNLFRIHSGSKREPFYQTTIKLDNSACVILVHLKTLETIGNIEELYVNVSLDVKLQSSSSFHLLIVHAVQTFLCVPVVYALMTAKTQNMYAGIFTYMRENLSTYIKPSTIMSNYDADIHSALAYVYPEATIKGYWFQYTDAVLKNIKSNNLQRETFRGHSLSGLRMILALPLLPAEYMVPGLDSIRKWAQEKNIYSTAFQQLCSYVEQSWLRAIGADKMSIFGMPHSVYNHTQHFNKELKNSLGNEIPLIWHVLECITHIATRTFVKCIKQSKHPKTKQPNKSQQAIDTIIKNATQLWIRTPVHLRNTLQFLQLSSHCINEAIHCSGYDSKFNVKTSNDNTVTVSSSCSTQSSSSDAANSTPCTVSVSSPAPTSSIVIPTAKLKLGSTIQLTIPTTPPSLSTISNNRIISSNEQSIQMQQSEVKRIPISATSIPKDNIKKYSLITAITSKNQPHELKSDDPPPLAFYPKNLKRKPIFFSATEPPPLVPIQKFC